MKPIIRVRDVIKGFRIVHNRPNNLKSMLIQTLRWQSPFGRTTSYRVLDGVSFDISPGEIVGIMGRNGAGKSTLFRLLSGIYIPDGGEITIQGRVAALVGLGAGFHADMSGFENIFMNAAILGFSRNEVLGKIDQIVDFAELGSHIHEPVKNYSSGMVLRLGFSIAVHIDASIILLDEILGVGDEGFQKKSLNKIMSLINEGRTIVLITHDSSAVLRHCNRCLVLDSGRILFDGDTKTGVDHYSSLFSVKNSS